MAPHALCEAAQDAGEPETKRQRLSTVETGHAVVTHRDDSLVDEHEAAAAALSTPIRPTEPSSTVGPTVNQVRPHPLGVKPLGNLYTSDHVNIKINAGLFSMLPDELLFDLMQCLHAPDLLRLGGTCRALYAFSRHDEVWRALFVEHAPESFRWLGNWQSTYCGRPMKSDIDCRQMYSDAIFRPHFCTHTPLEPFVDGIPAKNQIARLQDMSHDEFMNDGWAYKPFILTEPVKKWPVYRDWSKQRLLEKYGKTPFRAEAVDWPLERYLEYMDCSTDESPLYLFDCCFAEKMGLTPGDRPVPADKQPDYTPPSAFGSDLFNVLGNTRPNDRWLIVGPARSGSTFHKDPNGTSAWNAVLSGSKYWLMFPSSISTKHAVSGQSKTEAIPPPPGVFLSPDGSEVTSPLSIAEYMLSFHAAARKTPHCVEGICHAGEILHVPSGWFHLVLNLDESIALTQNFIAEAHLKDVLLFLRDTPEQISGFSRETKAEAIFGLFMEKLKTQHPEIAARAEHELARHDTQANKPEARSKWEQLTEESAAGFSFGFGGSDTSNDDEA